MGIGGDGGVCDPDFDGGMHVNSIRRYRDPGEVDAATKPVLETSYCFWTFMKRN
jgi:hypothetical protein